MPYSCSLCLDTLEEEQFCLKILFNEKFPCWREKNLLLVCSSLPQLKKFNSVSTLGTQSWRREAERRRYKKSEVVSLSYVSSSAAGKPEAQHTASLDLGKLLMVEHCRELCCLLKVTVYITLPRFLCLWKVGRRVEKQEKTPEIQDQKSQRHWGCDFKKCWEK